MDAAMLVGMRKYHNNDLLGDLDILRKVDEYFRSNSSSESYLIEILFNLS